jgi:UDP-glucuronate 4-epimerase
MRILVTGAAGFIGYHVCRRLLEEGGHEVLGLDNFNDYYPVSLKRDRMARLTARANFSVVEGDLAEGDLYASAHRTFRPDGVIHLGAQAGVRYSLEQPEAYVSSNLLGFTKVLEAVRRDPPAHLVYASSSSVYGAGSVSPFREDEAADRPVSFYAATKRANELMAHSYAHLFGLPVTGLRFFTVYGSWGRPDMAPMLFSRAICEGRPIRLFNHGKNLRDFTHVDDIASGVLAALRHPPAADLAAGRAPARVLNLGHNEPVETLRFVALLEAALGRKATLEMLGPQPGDMESTCADLTLARESIGYGPRVALEDGLAEFARWFLPYHGFGGE